MTKEPKELYNGFLFLRTGDKVDSPLGAYTLNLKYVNIDCLEEEFEEKIEALKNGKDVTIKLVCNKVEVVSPERIIEYAYGKQKQSEIEPEAISKWKKEFKEYIDSLDIARDDWKGIIEYIDELPSIQPNHCAEVGKKVLIDRQEALETIRTMQTYKLFAGDDMLLIDQAEAQTELMMLPTIQPERKDAVEKAVAVEAISDELMSRFDISTTYAYEVAEKAMNRIEAMAKELERGEQE